MGAECPNRHGRQKIVQNITADGKAPHTSNDIIARKLACGCVLASGQFEAFQAAVGEVRSWKAKEMQRIERSATAQMGRAYTEFVIPEDEENAK